MSDWVGGLPRAAHDRIDRQRASSTPGSLLSAPATAALRGAGMTAAGEVFGCLVMNLGWSGSQGCGGYGGAFGGGYGGGYRGGFGGGGLFPNSGGFSGGGYGGNQGGGLFGGGFGGNGWVSPVLTTEASGWNAFGPYVQAYEAGWHGAVHRMLLEAAALGAEGVVGVQVGRQWLDGSVWEFSALGTAVRVTDRSLVGRDVDGHLWAADLTAEDVAAAVHSGRQPRGIAFGLAISTKHEDWQLQQQRASWTGQEVDGLSELLHASRDAARNRVTASAQRIGGGTLVVTGLSTREFDTPCGDKETDLHAETAVQGTVLGPSPAAAFRATDRPGTARVLPVLPLRPTGASARLR